MCGEQGWRGQSERGAVCGEGAIYNSGVLGGVLVEGARRRWRRVVWKGQGRGGVVSVHVGERSQLGWECTV